MKKRVWIDTETTGLWANKDKIVELALIFQEEGKKDETFHKYIKYGSYPERYDEACRIHGLSPEILEKQGEEEKVVFEAAKAFLESKINSFDKEDKAVLCGYNVKFDNDFFRQMFKTFGDNYFGSYFIRINFCIMGKCAEAHMKGFIPLLPKFKLENIAEYFKIQFKAHSAIEDIKVTMQIDSLLDKLLERK